jgi:ribonuclease R
MGPGQRRGRGAASKESRGQLPAVGVLAITAISFDGEMQGHPVGWPDDRPLPTLRVVAERGAPALGVGERAVVRYARLADGAWEARIIRAVDAAPDRVLGIFRLGPEGGRIEPTDRKARTEYRVAQRDRAGAEDGEIVLAEVTSQHPRLGLPEAKITERVGSSADPRAFSLIAIYTHGIPTAFAPEAVALAEAARPVSLGAREDLRAVPLVTIDGADARDFDDAVFAEPDAERAGGWHAIVAIADVAWYVRPGDALDRDARERGNSVYFPDRVVPMLPEALSNELCSLKPEVERACVAVHLSIDGEGRLTRHRFVRGLMRSARRFTYEAAQAEHDTPALRPLYGVFRALDAARRKRGSLELDLPERQIVFDEAGKIARIVPRARLDSHRLIEELMIAANVAAAERLEQLRRPCMYRVHDQPDPAKLAALREFLESLGLPALRLAKGQVIRPRLFNDILSKADQTPYAPMIHQLVLRSQAQAVYSPANLGHFGLGLRRYAHFTSPIRRYSDLLVHRALVGDLPATDDKAFAALGEHVSMTERRAAAAERSASDRYLAAFLAERVGASFAAHVNGVTRAGLFVTLDETGADGLIPMRSLGGDYWEHDEAHHRLIGRRTRRVFTLGDPLTARLAEANGITGSLLFALEPVASDRPPVGRSHRKR